jgi:hypothetical protein
MQKTVDFRSQQVESCVVTARIGFLPVTERVALPGEAREVGIPATFCHSHLDVIAVYAFELTMRS